MAGDPKSVTAASQRKTRPLPADRSGDNSITLTLEAEPKSAEKLFGPRIERARRYVEILARDSERLGLLGPREFPRIWSRHVAHCALLADTVARAASSNSAELGSGLEGDCLDIGSGAGLPGIPLAIALPDRHFTLLEPMDRRAQWLHTVIEELGITNASVVRQRAEEHRVRYRVITARAVAPLKNLISLAKPLLSPDPRSVELFIKGQNAEAEIAESSKIIDKENLAKPELLILGRDLGVEPLTVVRITRQR